MIAPALAAATTTPHDDTLWALLPVACVPRGGVFEPIQRGQRLLITAHGTFIEACTPALYLRLPVGVFLTPWGEVEPVLLPRHGPIPKALARALQSMALAAHPKEMAALVVADDHVAGGYRLVVPKASGGVGHVSYRDDGWEDGSLVIDAHSHGPFGAYFSATDDASDRSRLDPHISIVFGQCESPATVVRVARVCIGAMFIDIPSELLEGLFA